jgi:hypothetical protein
LYWRQFGGNGKIPRNFGNFVDLNKPRDKEFCNGMVFCPRFVPVAVFLEKRL